jgi:hypothetical protein
MKTRIEANGGRKARCSLREMAWQLPLRLASGAFVLNSGVGKAKVDDSAAAQLHGFATGTYPFLAQLEPKQFARALSTTEIVIGSALLIPVVPAPLAGLALTGFAGGLLGLYLRTPGMREPGSLRPSEAALKGLVRDRAGEVRRPRQSGPASPGAALAGGKG